MKGTSQKKINFFQDIILQWSKANGRSFIWRQPGLAPFQYVIAEVLLQRTKAETVAKFFDSFILEYPNWDALATTNIEAIEKFLTPIGLYRQRARRLKGLALEMVNRKGQLPNDRQELELIPFVGQYIANAIELVVFHKRSPLIDVNMSRVLERFFGPRKLADIRYDPYLQSLGYAVVDHPQSKAINWAILDFAAIVCKPKPLCLICPLSKKCKYYESLVQTDRRRKQRH